MLYRKIGRTWRFEQTRTSAAIITVDERGESGFDGDMFFSRPIDSDEVIEIDDSSFEGEARGLMESLGMNVLERAVVTRGTATHQFARRHWRETFVRLHVTFFSNALHTFVECDLAGGTALDLRPAEQIIEAIRSKPLLLSPGQITLRVAPLVTAHLTRLLERSIAPDTSLKPPLELRQQAPEEFPCDGEGETIADRVLLDVSPGSITAHEPVTKYRPSYRSPAQKYSVHLQLRRPIAGSPSCNADAIAVTGAEATASGFALEMLLLIDDAASIGRLHLTVDELAAKLYTTSSPSMWFPLDGGTWGSEAILVDVPVR